MKLREIFHWNCHYNNNLNAECFLGSQRELLHVKNQSFYRETYINTRKCSAVNTVVKNKRPLSLDSDGTFYVVHYVASIRTVKCVESQRVVSSIVCTLNHKLLIWAL
ncbi:hypothetical protein SAY87_011382 [Trapa incisa]|uniref:Uncharacterized protein n=1 Tax=Trapa incisa TaxID=236973 RepID=A0AAN7GFH3_9MYRT|nr:hypothetical protein SAY87_011382 [Trapa incisa]